MNNRENKNNETRDQKQQQWWRWWAREVAVVAVLGAVCVAQRLRDVHGSSSNSSGGTCSPFWAFRDDRVRDLSRPFVAHETVPFALLFPLALAALAADTAVRVLAAPQPQRVHVLVAGTLSAAQCFFGAIAAAQLLKGRVCRLRPDYVTREHLAATATEGTAGTGSFFAAALLADGRISFPSGHAALLAAVALLLVCRTWRAHLRRQTQSAARVLAAVLYCVLLVVGAAAVAATRVRDNRHHVSDVVAGAVVGAATALLCDHHWARIESGRNVRKKAKQE